MIRPSQAMVACALAVLLCGCGAGTRINIQGPGHRLRQMQRGEEVVRDPMALLKVADMGTIRQHRRDPDEVSVSIRMSRGVPLMDARLNNHPISLILDTGCQPTLVVDRDVAVSAKVPVLRIANGSLVLQGTLGNEAGSLGRVEHLSLSDWQIEGLPCLIRSQQTYLGSSSQRQQVPVNLFGMALPLRVCSYLTVDYPRGRAVFGFHKRYVPSGGGQVWNVPLILRDGTPHVRLSYRGVKWEALVDTGTTAALTITPQLAQRCGVMSSLTKTDVPILGVGAANGAGPRIQRVALPLVHGLGPELRDLTVNVASYSPRVGSRLLSRYRVTFDFQKQCLWLEE